MSKAELFYQNQPASGKEMGEAPEELNYEQIIRSALREKLVRICRRKIHMEPLNLTATLQNEKVNVDNFSPLDVLELAEDVSRRYPFGLIFVDMAKGTHVLMNGTYCFRCDKVRTSLTEREKLDYENWFSWHLYNSYSERFPGMFSPENLDDLSCAFRSGPLYERIIRLR
jgi:hypothetical protein